MKSLYFSPALHSMEAAAKELQQEALFLSFRRGRQRPVPEGVLNGPCESTAHALKNSLPFKTKNKKFQSRDFSFP